MYYAVNLAYPNKVKPYEMKITSCGYWDDEKNVIEYVKDFIKEKKIKEESIPKYSRRSIVSMGFNNNLFKKYNNSYYDLINAVYPNKFKKEHFKFSSKMK